MDGNSYQPYTNPADLPYAPSLPNSSTETMPPLAPSYKHLPSAPERNNYPAYSSDQETVNRLMDSVHEGRMENIRVGQQTLGIHLEDVRIMQGGIEVDAQIIPKPGAYNETIPPTARSYKHLPSALEGNYPPVYNSDQQTVNRLLDSVHEGRTEDIHIGQERMGIRLQDVHIMQGAIEVQAQIIPTPGASPGNNYSGYLNSASSYKQPAYSYPYQYPNQFAYQSPNQPAYQYPYPYQPQYPYPNQVVPPQYLPQYSYRNSYPGQFPTQYLYQYPVTNLAGSIANTINQLSFTARLLRW